MALNTSLKSHSIVSRDRRLFSHCIFGPKGWGFHCGGISVEGCGGGSLPAKEGNGEKEIPNKLRDATNTKNFVLIVSPIWTKQEAVDPIGWEARIRGNNGDVVAGCM